MHHAITITLEVIAVGMRRLWIAPSTALFSSQRISSKHKESLAPALSGIPSAARDPYSHDIFRFCLTVAAEFSRTFQNSPWFARMALSRSLQYRFVNYVCIIGLSA